MKKLLELHWSGENKEECRDLATKKIKDETYDCCIFLPSMDCKDVIKALENKIISLETKLILVEGFYRK